MEQLSQESHSNLMMHFQITNQIGLMDHQMEFNSHLIWTWIQSLFMMIVW